MDGRLFVWLRNFFFHDYGKDWNNTTKCVGSSVIVTYDGEIHEYLKPYITSQLTDPDAPIEDKKNFVKQFQQFDKSLAALQTYDESDDVDLDKDYSINEETMDSLQETYETLVDQLKKDKDENEEVTDPVDTDYELESVINKSVNYQYILSLIQSYVPNDTSSAIDIDKSESNEIDNYISELDKTNKPLADIINRLWGNIKEHPEKYAGKQVDQLLNEMVDQAYDQELSAFADKYHLSLDDLRFVIKNYDVHVSKQAGVNQMLNRDAFKAFKESNANSELKRMMDWKKQVRSQLYDLYVNHIAPLVNE